MLTLTSDTPKRAKALIEIAHRHQDHLSLTSNDVSDVIIQSRGRYFALEVHTATVYRNDDSTLVTVDFDPDALQSQKNKLTSWTPNSDEAFIELRTNAPLELLQANLNIEGNTVNLNVEQA